MYHNAPKDTAMTSATSTKNAPSTFALDKRTLILFPLMFVFYEMATYLSNDMYLPALPSMSHDLSLSFSQAQFTLTSWFIGASIWQLLLGPLSDRYGRRPILFFGGFAFVWGSLVCATTQSLTAFMFARFVQGSTISSMLIAGYASINELLNETQAIRTQAWMSSITILAPAFGPLAGSALLPVGSWRSIFYLLAFMAMIPLCVLWKIMPESLPKEQPLTLKTKFTEYKSILRNALFWRYTSASCFLFSAIIIWLAAGPFLIVDVFHQPVYFFGLYQIIVFGSFMLGTRVLGYFIEQKDAKFFIKMGIACSLLGASILLLGALFMPTIHTLIIGLMVFLFGTGLSFSPLHRLAIVACDEPMGAVIALYTNIRSAFGMLASIIISALGECNLLSVSLMFCAAVLLTIFFYLLPARELEVVQALE